MVSCFSYIWLGAASESAFMAPTLERNHPTAEESRPQVELSMYYAIIVALTVKQIDVLFPTSFGLISIQPLMIFLKSQTTC